MIRRPLCVLLPIALLARTITGRSRLDRIHDLVTRVARDGQSNCYLGIYPGRIDRLVGLLSEYGVAVSAVDGGGRHQLRPRSM